MWTSRIIALAIWLADVWGTSYVAHQFSWGQWQAIPIAATSTVVAIVGIMVLVHGINRGKSPFQKSIRS